MLSYLTFKEEKKRREMSEFDDVIHEILKVLSC